jgi:hypothetical protein
MLSFAMLPLHTGPLFWICSSVLAVAAIFATYRNRSILALVLMLILAWGFMFWVLGETGYRGPVVSLRFASIPLTAAILVVLITRFIDEHNRYCGPALGVLLGMVLLLWVLDRTTHGTATMPIVLSVVPLAAGTIIVSVVFLRKIL